MKDKVEAKTRRGQHKKLGHKTHTYSKHIHKYKMFRDMLKQIKNRKRHMPRKRKRKDRSRRYRSLSLPPVFQMFPSSNNWTVPFHRCLPPSMSPLFLLHLTIALIIITITVTVTQCTIVTEMKARRPNRKIIIAFVSPIPPPQFYFNQLRTVKTVTFKFSILSGSWIGFALAIFQADL